MLTPILALLFLLNSPRASAMHIGFMPPPSTEISADADGDGVADGRDSCAATPSGYPVLVNGCASDSDGDGVADGADNCPGTHTDAVEIDRHGCSVRDRKHDNSIRFPVRFA